jgi:hypothetical protein
MHRSSPTRRPGDRDIAVVEVGVVLSRRALSIRNRIAGCVVRSAISVVLNQAAASVSVSISSGQGWSAVVGGMGLVAQNASCWWMVSSGSIRLWVGSLSTPVSPVHSMLMPDSSGTSRTTLCLANSPTSIRPAGSSQLPIDATDQQEFACAVAERGKGGGRGSSKDASCWSSLHEVAVLRRRATNPAPPSTGPTKRSRQILVDLPDGRAGAGGHPHLTGRRCNSATRRGGRDRSGAALPDGS